MKRSAIKSPALPESIGSIIIDPLTGIIYTLGIICQGQKKGI
jgi:hypothetical protein